MCYTFYFFRVPYNCGEKNSNDRIIELIVLSNIKLTHTNHIILFFFFHSQIHNKFYDSVFEDHTGMKLALSQYKNVVTMIDFS